MMKRLCPDKIIFYGSVPDDCSYLSSLRRKKRRVVTEDEPFDLYDIELSEEDFAAE